MELLKFLMTCIDNNIEVDVIPDPCFKSVSIRLFNKDVYKEAALYYSDVLDVTREGKYYLVADPSGAWAK